jgi:hypothetical protein
MCAILLIGSIYAIIVILYSHKLIKEDDNIVIKSFQLEKRLQLKEQLKSLENKVLTDSFNY